MDGVLRDNPSWRRSLLGIAVVILKETALKTGGRGRGTESFREWYMLVVRAAHSGRPVPAGPPRAPAVVGRSCVGNPPRRR